MADPRRVQPERVRHGIGPDDGYSQAGIIGDAGRPDAISDRMPQVQGSLRRHAARGTMINAAFQIGLAVVALVQRLLVAIILTPADLGLWGIIMITVLTLMFLKDTGISEKFVQQSEVDQEVAFQKAFTFELLISAGFILVALFVLPVFAIAYGRWDILLPALALTPVVVGNSLQAPTWIFYRRMDFVRQRSLQAINPLTTFVITIGLAVAGFGYWSLVVGAVSGAWVAGLVALRACPYRIRLRFDRPTARSYFSFSWPLVVAGGSTAVLAQGSALAGSHTVGLVGVGAITLAASIVTFSDGVDTIITGTLYPAICAVSDRADLLAEIFVKSNRVALLWGVPFGLGLTLFASDLVHFVLGEKWVPAIVVIQAFGLIAAADQVAFNWSAFLRALNQTRPIAVVGIVFAGSFLTITIPLMVLDGLQGFAIGMMLTTVFSLVLRTYYLGRLLADFKILWHAARSMKTSVPAVAFVLLMRLLEPGARSLPMALVELALYGALTVAATVLFERPLLREMLGYLRPERPRPMAATA